MADPDGPPSEKNDPRYFVPPALKPVAPAPRVNPPNINTPKAAPAAGGAPGFLDFLEWMRSQGGAESAPAPANARTLIPKEKKKFQRRDAEGKTDAPVLPVPDAPETPEEAAPVDEEPFAPVADGATAVLTQAPPAQNPLPSLEPLKPRQRRQQGSPKRASWSGLLTQLGFLVLLAGSFVVGRISVPKVTPATVAPAAPVVVNNDGTVTTKLLSDANAALIDQAMAAEQSGDFRKAEDLLSKVKESGEHVNGLSLQLAQLAVYEKDFNRALPLLNKSLSEGENLGEVYNLRATLSNRGALVRGGGMNDYETATKLDPFESRNFYYWGEALRRTGKDQAALVRLREALDRLREPALESLYRLKIRLALIEAGQENEFAENLAKQMVSPNPEMDWLITAAALEMHRGNYAAAAEDLDRASRRGDAESFALRLRDYFLYQFKFEKELMRFYVREPAAKAGSADNVATPGDSPPPAASPPAIGLEMPAMPPAASPGASVPR